MDTATILFLLSGAFILYVLILYPLTLACHPRRRRPAKPRIGGAPRLSVVVAVHNGEAWIRQKLRSILASDYPPDRLEILVVSDGSTDRTEKIAREYASHGVQVIAVPRGGKARAVNVGVAHATGDVVVLTDVRQKLHPACLKNLVARLEDPSVGAVGAELITARGDGAEGASVSLYWRYDVWLRTQQSAIHSTFGVSGACYALRREVTVALPEDCLLDDVYLPMAAYFRGYRIVLEATANVFEHPTSVAVEFRRKKRTLGGLYQILRWYPKLLLPGHPMWFHFLSYKFFRLFLPHALLVNLGAAVFLPGPWAAAAVFGHLAVYGLAAMDGLVPDGSILKRAASPARMFIMMMVAAFCAQSIFFVEPQKLWKVTDVRLPAEQS